MPELALHLLVLLADHHHPEGLRPGEVKREVQLLEYELLPGIVKHCTLLDAPCLHEVVAQLGKPLQELHGLLVQVELPLRVLPLVAEDEHDPGVELGEGGGHVPLPRLVEDGADEPQVEWVAGKGEYVPVVAAVKSILDKLLL